MSVVLVLIYNYVVILVCMLHILKWPDRKSIGWRTKEMVAIAKVNKSQTAISQMWGTQKGHVIHKILSR